MAHSFTCGIFLISYIQFDMARATTYYNTNGNYFSAVSNVSLNKINHKFDVLNNYINQLEMLVNKTSSKQKNFQKLSSTVKYIDFYTNIANLFNKTHSEIDSVPSHRSDYLMSRLRNSKPAAQYQVDRTRAYQRQTLAVDATNIQKIPGRLENTTTTVPDLTEVVEWLLQRNMTGDLLDAAEKAVDGRGAANGLDDARRLNVADDRFLGLFTRIQFDNEPCSVQRAYGSYDGTCYHATECRSLAGSSLGPCDHFYGVCCLFQHTCGQRTSQMRSYFMNPDYPKPSTTKLTCDFVIEKAGSDIRYVRLDFEHFELNHPANGTCLGDQFVISGFDINIVIPILCGIITGQHLYLSVNDANGPLRFSVLSDTSEEKIFRVKITQIPERNTGGIMPNCLQYFTGVDGQFESFNYAEKGTVILNNNPGYLNNLNYAVCIEKLPGYCTVTYMNVNEGRTYPFELKNLDESGDLLFPPGQAGVEIFNCPDDYLVLNGIRLCGDRFNDGLLVDDFRSNSPVTDESAGPFILPVKTNENISGRGFKLFYKQNKCMNL